MNGDSYLPDRPKRVLFVQKFSTLGGGQKSLVQHLELLDRARYESFLLTSNTGWLTEQMDRLNVPWSLVKFGHWTNPLSMFRHVMLIWRLCRYVHDHKIDLIHANEHWIAPPCLIAARLCGIPVICHFRTGLQDLTPRRIARYQYRRFDRVIAVAEVLKSAMTPYLTQPDRVVVVRDGVEPFPGESRDHSHRRAKIAINVGAIYPVKGQALILDHAMSWLKAGRRHFLIFVGGIRESPEYVAKMRELVRRENLQKQVLFLGPRQDVPRLLRVADVLIAYSTVEGVPRVVMEAMFAGKPVIVSNTPGMSEVVTDGTVGRIIDFERDPHALSAALKELDERPERWTDMGRQGRIEALNRYSTQAMTCAIQAIYNELLERHGHERHPA